MLSRIAFATVFTLATVVKTSTDVGGGPTSYQEVHQQYEQFVNDFKKNIDVDAITLKVSQELQADRKFTQVREKLVEDMTDEAETMRASGADDLAWAKFKLKWTKKWDQYRSASANQK